jgi:hypothetical protein
MGLINRYDAIHDCDLETRMTANLVVCNVDNFQGMGVRLENPFQ